MSRYENARTHCGSPGANQNTLHRYSSTPTNLILDSVENVKPNGQGWVGCCPVHESKSRSSLSIKQAEDGRVLLHCFAGCSALEIVHALGLELADLFERPITLNPSPQQKREWRDKAKLALWKSCRDDLIVEMNVLLLGAGDLYRGKSLSREDMDRMLLAGKRWRNALGEL